MSRLCVSRIESNAMLTRTTILLPASGILVALTLLEIGTKQVPTILVDSPPFVAPATELCCAINAPVALLLGGLLMLAHSIRFEQIILGTPTWQAVFLGGVGLLWFIVGFEVELRLTKTPSRRHRLVAALLATTLVVALVPIGVVAWRQDQVWLSVGCVTWSAVVALFYGFDLTRLAVSRIQAR